MRKKADAHRVALAILPDAPLLELAAPCEVFGIDRPELADPWYALTVCQTEPGARTAHGFLPTATGDLDDLVAADTVIVPASQNALARRPAALLEALVEAHARGARIASICAGAFILAEAGLLDGRRATTHWMHAEAFRRRYPRVLLDESVINTTDGRLHTSAGTVAAIDLCIDLVRQDHGREVANALARRMVTPPHREADQAQFITAPVPASPSTSLGDVTQWARSRLAEPLRLRDLAARAHLSERQLTRRFLQSYGVSPGAWLARERLHRAQELLEGSDATIETVAAESGFGSAAGLRSAFATHVHCSPSEYRATWRGGDQSLEARSAAS